MVTAPQDVNLARGAHDDTHRRQRQVGYLVELEVRRGQVDAEPQVPLAHAPERVREVRGGQRASRGGEIVEVPRPGRPYPAALSRLGQQPRYGSRVCCSSASRHASSHASSGPPVRRRAPRGARQARKAPSKTTAERRVRVPGRPPERGSAALSSRARSARVHSRSFTRGRNTPISCSAHRASSATPAWFSTSRQ